MRKTGIIKTTYKQGELVKLGEKTYKVMWIYQLSDEKMFEYNLYGKNRVTMINIDNVTDVMDFAISEDVA